MALITRKEGNTKVKKITEGEGKISEVQGQSDSVWKVKDEPEAKAEEKDKRPPSAVDIDTLECANVLSRRSCNIQVSMRGNDLSVASCLEKMKGSKDVITIWSR